MTRRVPVVFPKRGCRVAGRDGIVPVLNSQPAERAAKFLSKGPSVRAPGFRELHVADPVRREVAHAHIQLEGERYAAIGVVNTVDDRDAAPVGYPLRTLR